MVPMPRLTSPDPFNNDDPEAVDMAKELPALKLILNLFRHQLRYRPFFTFPKMLCSTTTVLESEIDRP